MCVLLLNELSLLQGSNRAIPSIIGVQKMIEDMSTDETVPSCQQNKWLGRSSYLLGSPKCDEKENDSSLSQLRN